MDERSEPRRVWSVSGLGMGIMFPALGVTLLVVALACVGHALTGPTGPFGGVGVIGFLSLIPIMFGIGMEQAGTEERAEERLDRVGIASSAEVTSSGWESPQSQGGPYWVVRYRYEVDGEAYAGRRDFKVEARSGLPGIEAGCQITILHDPDRPKISGWLEPSLSSYARRHSMFSSRP
jgi:hypothetical protein